MTWSRFDDLYDEHEKVEDAWDRDPATIGLHVMATTHCNRLLTDGVIRPRWLARKLPVAVRRRKVLQIMVDVELFDFLPKGEVRHCTDRDGNVVELGPFDEDRYIVHDFLDRHDSARMVTERRKSDADRKRAGRRPDSKKRPLGLQPDPETVPREVPPLRGGRQRDRQVREDWIKAVAAEYDDPARAAYAVKQAVTSAAVKDVDGVHQHVAQWFPDLRRQTAEVAA